MIHVSAKWVAVVESLKENGLHLEAIERQYLAFARLALAVDTLLRLKEIDRIDLRRVSLSSSSSIYDEFLLFLLSLVPYLLLALK